MSIFQRAGRRNVTVLPDIPVRQWAHGSQRNRTVRFSRGGSPIDTTDWVITLDIEYYSATSVEFTTDDATPTITGPQAISAPGGVETPALTVVTPNQGRWTLYIPDGVFPSNVDPIAPTSRTMVMIHALASESASATANKYVIPLILLVNAHGV